MSHIIKDFFMGSVLLTLGIVLSFAAFLCLLFFWIFIHVLGVLVWVFFIIFAFLSVIWLVGYIYRKMQVK